MENEVKRLWQDKIDTSWVVQPAVFKALHVGSVLHAVGFNPALGLRLRNTIAGIPSAAQACAAPVDEQAAQQIMSTGNLDQPAQARKFDPQECILFVRATRRLKRLSHAQSDANEIAQAQFPHLYEDLRTEGRQFPGRHFLVRSRVLLDLAMMLTMRRCYLEFRKQHEEDKEFIDLFMFADGSPSSGFEALPIIEQCMFSGAEVDVKLTERLLPVCYMGFGFMGLIDKMYSILWAFFLECGPNPALIRFRCSRIRSWTTDMGTECGLADGQDVLPAFMASIGYTGYIKPQRFLFDRCFWIPGWHHLADNLAKAVLGGLRWWPAWLADARSIVKVFRVHSYREVFASRSHSHGFSSKEARKSPPNFAHWRWGTLMNVLDWMIPLMPPLEACWDSSMLAKSKNGATVKKADAAIRRHAFWLQLRIVRDAMSSISHFRTWASGCDCHWRERLAGKAVSCNMQGRRLPSAIARLEQLEEDCARWSRGPADDHMCGGVQLDADLSSDRCWVFQAIAGIASTKLGFFRQQPWSLGRCRDRTHMKALRDEYDSMDPAQRHRVADELFHDLRPDVDRYIADSDCSQRLMQVIRSIEYAPITEECVEAPHSHMQRERLRQRASSRPWQSATQRMHCNIEFWEVMPPHARTNFAIDFRSVKRLLQVEPRLADRPKRIAWPKFLGQVYRSTMDVTRFDKTVTVASEGIASLKVDRFDQVKIEFLSLALQKKHFYTYEPLGGKPSRCFQVVWLFSSRAKYACSVFSHTAALDMGVIWFEVWPSALTPENELEVYQSGETVHIDALKLGPWPSVRKWLRVWDSGLSDVLGCIRLQNPRVPEPKLSELGLADPKVPILLLLERMRSLGWVDSSKDRPAKPSTEPIATVFSKALVLCRSYLQCLVHIESLWEKGLRRLPHSAPVSFYSMLMRSEEPGKLDPKLSAKQLSRMLLASKPQSELRAGAGEAFVFSDDEAPLLGDDELGEPEREDSASEAPGAAAAVIDDEGFVMSDDEGGEVPVADASGDDGGSGAGHCSGSTGSGSCAGPDSSGASGTSSSSSNEDGYVAEGAPPVPKAPKNWTFGEISIRRDDFDHATDPTRSHRRLLVQCLVHPGCSKRRGVGPGQCSRLGELEPYAFLVAWCEDAALAGEDLHSRHKPTEAHVDDSFHRISASMA